MFKKSLVIISLLSTSTFALAETSVPNTFSAGSNIVAAEMNANFNAVTAGINENATVIAELLTRIEQLEANSSSSVVGRSYQLSQIGILNRGKIYPDNVVHYNSLTVGNLTQNYTLTLSTGNTFTLIGAESEGEVELTGDVNIWNNKTPFSATGVYSQNGTQLTLTFDNDGSSQAITVSKDGRSLLVSDFKGKAADGSGWYRTESSFVVGIEITP